jgi:hypothetical protein
MRGLTFVVRDVKATEIYGSMTDEHDDNFEFTNIWKYQRRAKAC